MVGSTRMPRTLPGGLRPRQQVREAFWRRDAYVLLFGLLLVDYTILTLANSPRWGGLVRVVPVSCTLLWAVYTSNASQRLIRTTQWMIVAAVVGSTVQAATDDRVAGGITFALLTVLLVVTPVQIVRRVFEHQRVDLRTIFAVIDVYVLLGLIFGAVFLSIDKLLYAAGKHHLTFLAQPGYHPASNFMYLSFVTLTTVGFGDLTPYTNMARSVVVLEALLGQIFLVTVVARVVALAGYEMPMRRRHDEHGSAVGAEHRDGLSAPSGSIWASPDAPAPPDMTGPPLPDLPDPDLPA